MAFNCSTNDSSSCLLNLEQTIDEYDKNIERHVKQQLISDEIKETLEIYIHVITFIATSLFGIITNVINVTVYWRQGLTDSITLGFFSLSISDLFLVSMSLTTGLCYMAKAVLPHSNIDFPSVHYVSSGTFRNMGYSLSSVLTAFLSLERCCCVVLPFKVKYIFTRSRTVVVLWCILIFHVASYVPFFATQELRWQPLNNNIDVNSTMTFRLSVHFSKDRSTVQTFSYILLGIITPTLSQFVVTVCAIVLSNGLRASSKFRQAMNPKKQELKEPNGDNATSLKSNPQGQEEATSSGGLSIRDARLVKTMIFLVAILSMSNVPLLVITYAQSFIPEFNIGKTYQNTYSTCYSIVYVLSNLNASVNIFVYYHTSTKYREIFKSIFNSKPSTPTM